MANNNNPTPAGYSVQFGYGVQPESKATEYIDSKGVRLNHTFTEINNLFGSSGDTLIGTKRTGVASGSTLSQSLDSISQSIVNGEGNYADLDYYYRRNTKSITTMEVKENDLWAGGLGAIVTNDTSKARIGGQSLKVQENDNIAGALTASRSFNVPLDLTKFNDGSTSVDSDYIRFAFYVSNTAKVDTAATHGVVIILSTDPIATGTNRFFLSVTTIVNGWNFVNAKKSDFTMQGVANWNNINGMRCAWFSTINAINEYVNFDDCWLCRVDPTDATQPNPFQRYINSQWQIDFEIRAGYWYVGLDTATPVVVSMLDSDTSYSFVNSLVGTETYADFKTEVMFNVVTVNGSGQGYSPYLTFLVSTSKFIVAYISNGILTLTSQFDTLITTTTANFVCGSGDSVVLTLEKIGTTVIARAKTIKDSAEAITNHSIQSTENGVICLGNYGIKPCVENFGITVTRYASEAGNAYMIGNVPWQYVANSFNDNKTYYINGTSGSDLNNGLSAGAAFQSVFRVYAEPCFNAYVINGDIVINIATGTYTDTLLSLPVSLGGGSISFIGTKAASVIVPNIGGTNCNLKGAYQHLTLSRNTGFAMDFTECIRVHCTDIITTATADYGLVAYESNVWLTSCVISNKVSAAAIGIEPGCDIYFENCTGSGNQYSMIVQDAAIGHGYGTFPASTLSSVAVSGSHIWL